METPDLNQITDLVAKQRVGTQSFLGGQDVKSSDFLKRYTDFITGQEGSAAMYKRIGEELGVPQLQTNANLLRNTLTNLPSTYSKATTGYDVNTNQLARIIGQKAGELSPAVETTERALSSAQGNLTTRMGLEQADQERLAKPFGVEHDILSDRLARETTLFSQDNERELDALVAKINSGITLSEGEKNRAQELATNERNFEIEKQKLNSTEIVTVGGRKKLINKQTGQVIADLGSSSEGGGVSNVTSYLPSGSSTGTKSDLSSFYEPSTTKITPVDPLRALQEKQKLESGINWSNINLSGVTGLK